jgi:hypothetical protein
MGSTMLANCRYQRGVLWIRNLTSAAVLAGLALTSLVPSAEARVHRFSPANDVTVSFEWPRSSTSRTLLRFARNRLSLTSNAGRALTLRRAGGHGARLAAPRGGTARVRIELSAGRGRARLIVGRATTTLAGRFVAEDAVAVGGARLRALRIRTATSRAAHGSGPSAAPQSPAAPTIPPRDPASPSPPSGSALFAPTSVWNAPLANDAPLDPASGVLVKTLRDTVAQNVAAGWGPWISTRETSPLYTVPAKQPTVRVQLDPGSWKVGLQYTFEAVPIPPDASPAAGPDGHMTVWQPSTDHLWEFFQARKLADGWHASFGGSMSSASRSPGYYDTESWPGLSQTWWGSTATSLPVIAGTMMISELRAGVIPHALAMNIPWAKPNMYSWPAQRTDGASSDPNAIPEGARFRLDPKLDIDGLDLPPMTRMIAKAAQRYGMIVRDQTGHAISLFAENDAQYGTTNPYTGTNGFFGGPYPNPVLQAFPWDRLELLKMDLHTGS